MAGIKFGIEIGLVDKLSRGLSFLKKRVSGIGKTFQRLAKRGLLVLSVAIGAAGTAAIVAAGRMEQWDIALTTMLGSAEKAKDMLADLADFAKITPFTLPEVVENAKQLMAMGIEADKILPTMKSLGDVAAGLSIPLQRLALNFGQVKSQTKLTGRELRDFSIAGVPLLAVLATQLGKSTGEIRDMIQRGKIGFPQVEAAFKSMSSEGGRFYDLMIKQSESFFGIISNIKDSLFVLSADIGSIFLPSLKRIALAIKDSTSRLSDFIKEQKLANKAAEELQTKQLEKRIEKLQEEQREIKESMALDEAREKGLKGLISTTTEHFRNAFRERREIQKANTALIEEAQRRAANRNLENTRSNQQKLEDINRELLISSKVLEKKKTEDRIKNLKEQRDALINNNKDILMNTLGTYAAIEEASTKKLEKIVTAYDIIKQASDKAMSKASEDIIDYSGRIEITSENLEEMAFLLKDDLPVAMEETNKGMRAMSLAQMLAITRMRQAFTSWADFYETTAETVEDVGKEMARSLMNVIRETLIAEVVGEQLAAIAKIGIEIAKHIATLNLVGAAIAASQLVVPGVQAAVAIAGINSVLTPKFEHGGIVTGETLLQGRNMNAIVGEKGREAILPLDDPRSTELLREALGTKEQTINIEFNLEGEALQTFTEVINNKQMQLSMQGRA